MDHHSALFYVITANESDIIDEAIYYFKANVFFKNYEIKVRNASHLYSGPQWGKRQNINILNITYNCAHQMCGSLHVCSLIIIKSLRENVFSLSQAECSDACMCAAFESE